MGARGVGHLRYLCEIAPPRIGVVLNVGRGAHRRVRLGRGHRRRPRASWSRRCRRTGWPCSTPTTRGCARWRRGPRPAVVLVGEAADADVRADGRARWTSAAGASYTLVTPDGPRAGAARRRPAGTRSATRSPRRRSRWTLGMPLAELAAALGELRLVSTRRMDVFDRADGVTVIDDSYNANPASTAAALRALARSGRGGAPIAVLGYMAELGDYERAGHEEVGRLAAELGRRPAGRGGRAGRADPRRRGGGGGLGRRVGAGDRSGRRPSRCCASELRAGRRRAGQGLAVPHLGRGRRAARRDAGGRGGGADEGGHRRRRASRSSSRSSAPRSRSRCFTRLKAGQPIRSDGPADPPGQEGHARRWAAWCSSSPPCIAYVGRALRADHPAGRSRSRPSGPTIDRRWCCWACSSFCGAGRLHRRLPQGAQAQQPRPQQARQADRPDARRRGLRRRSRCTCPSDGKRRRPWPAPTSRSSGTSTGSTSARSARWSSSSSWSWRCPTRVNLTDGLDGLATGASVMVLGAYALIAFWQYRHWCADPELHRGNVLLRGARPAGDRDDRRRRRPAACVGFLWWNTSPARIFMGDTGALALGGLVAGLALATRPCCCCRSSACCS